MSLDREKIAKRLEATYVEHIGQVGAGAFAMAQLSARIKERLDPRNVRKGTGVAWIMNSKVPMTPETERMLIALADKLSTPEQRIDPMQLAAQLLEESVQRLAQQKSP